MMMMMGLVISTKLRGSDPYSVQFYRSILMEMDSVMFMLMMTMII